MIIECPQCGFSGRVPDHATLVPHQARCPKCRYRFDIGDPDVQHPEPVEAVLADPRHDPARPRMDPSDSSYELDPIVVGPDDPWEGPWSDGPDQPPGTTADAVLATRRPGGRPPAWAVRAFRPSTVRIRIFQAWAILFLAGAAAIGVRTAVAASRFDDDRFLSWDLLRPVAAIVLLVGAAALLCLSVDVSRRLARLTYGPNPPSRPARADRTARREG